MAQSRCINKKNIFQLLFELILIFICSFSLYYPLNLYAPYEDEFSKLKSDYIYTYNIDYSSYYDEAEKEEISLYHYDYGENIIYLNRQGSEMGIHVFGQGVTLGFFVFDINNSELLEENVKYDLVKDNLVNKTRFKTKLTEIDIGVDFLIVKNDLKSEDCEYKIFPPKKDQYIYDDIGLGGGYFSARGKTMKDAVYFSSDTSGMLLSMIAIIPTLILVVGISIYYSIDIDKRSKELFINYIFYTKKNKILLKVFLSYAARITLFGILSYIINYFIFVGNNLNLLFFPILLFVLMETVYLYLFTKAKINKITKEGVDIKYAD